MVAHDIVVLIARHDAVDKVEAFERRALLSEIVGEVERHAVAARKGVEAGDGAVGKRVVAAVQFHAVAAGVRDLAVAHVDVRHRGGEAVVCGVVQDRVFHHELLARQVVARFERQSRLGTVQVEVVDVIAVALRFQGHAAPLSRHAVIGLPLKHILEAVAAHHYGLVQRAEHEQRAVDDEPRLAVKVKPCAGRQRERRALCHYEAVLDAVGAGGVECAVFRNWRARQIDDRLPCGGELHLLHRAAARLEHEAVLMAHRLVRVELRRVGKEVNHDAVLTHHFKVRCAAFREWRAVYIHLESRACAAFEVDARQGNGLIGGVVGSEAHRSRRHSAHNCVKRHGVCREVKAVVGRCGHVLVRKARGEGAEQQGQ